MSLQPVCIGCCRLVVAEEFEVFALEVGGEDAFADVFDDFVGRPEASAVKFVGWGGDGFDGGSVGVDKFFVARRFKDVARQKFGCEVFKSDFFAGFSAKGCRGVFAEVDVAADGCVPFPGLDVFPFGAFLKVELTLWVEDVEVDDGVEQSAAVVTFASCCRADDLSGFVDERQEFVGIIVWHLFLFV